MSKDITNDLPPVVARHLAAGNGHDIDAWMATFDPDALVNDDRREFAGAERAVAATRAPASWKRRTTAAPMPRVPPVTSTRLPANSSAGVGKG